MALTELAGEMETLLQGAIGDANDYIEKLQAKADAILEAKENLQTYKDQAEEALKALENLQAIDMDDALDEAENLLSE